MSWNYGPHIVIRQERHFDDRVMPCFAQRPSGPYEAFERAAAARPDAQALVAGDLRLCYAALGERAARVAGALAKRGVGAGDRVAMLLGNRVEFVTTLLATLRLGAIAVPMGSRLQTPEIAYIVQHSGAKVLVHDADLASRLTNEECSPYTLHYAFDTVSSAKVVGSALVKAGFKTFYFITADYAFGLSLENDTGNVIKQNGGQVLGSVRHPLNASDFSSYLLQAQGSKAQVLVLANAGGDFTNAMKAAKEFGVVPPMKPAALVIYLNDVHSLGQANVEGLQYVDHWYWNQDDASRKFAKRFLEQYKRMPSSLQAADYAAVTNYLKAVQQAGTTDGEKVMAVLREMKFDDFYHKAYLRADGRVIHDMTLYEVKPVKDTKEPWDYVKAVAKVPGEQAFTALANSKCSLVKK